MRLALALLAALVLAPAASAGTFDVTSTVDAVDATPGDGVCASSAGACTLRAAIQEANASAGASSIHVPAGTYTLSLAGTDEDLAATGDLDARRTMTITGTGSAPSVVSGAFLDRVFDVPVSTATLALVNLDVRDGQVTDGAGISAAGTVQLARTVLENNTAARYGGGIRVLPGGTAFVTDSYVHGNRAFRGGGLENEGSVTVAGSTFAANTGSGGAVANAGVLGIERSTLVTNGCGSCSGGAVDNSGSAWLTDVTVANTASSALSGALHNTGSMTVRGSLVERGFGPECSGTITAAGHNLDRGTTCGFDLQSADPLLGPLQQNGGFAPTLLPDDASPVVDAGESDCLPTDERGLPRVGPCDLGAVELQSVILTVAPPANGRVAASAVGIDCPGRCSARVAPGTTVSLDAVPADGYRFAGWAASCGPAGGTTCTVRVSTATTVTPTFAAQPVGPALTVQASGNGTVVDSATGAIACPTRCRATYARGESVTLVLVPADGQRVLDVDGCSLEGVFCTVVVRIPGVVSVRFSAPAAPPATTTTATTTSVTTTTVAAAPPAPPEPAPAPEPEPAPVGVVAAPAPPVARFTMTADGLAAVFDGSRSSGGAPIAGYAWQFGDGETAAGERPSHRYRRSGTYNVTLSVTDELGVSATVTAPVRVVARAAAKAVVSERVTVGDGAGAGGGVAANVTETVTIGDGATPKRGAAVGVAETIAVGDGASPRGPARVVVTATVATHLAPRVLPPAVVRVTGTISTKGSPTVGGRLTPTTTRRSP